MSRGLPVIRLPGCPLQLWHAGRVSIGPELTAVSSSLGELTKRVSRMLSELSPAEEERYGAGLAEVERTLGAASRRLDRLVTSGR